MDAFKFFQKKPNVISQIIKFFLCITLYYDKIIDKCFYKNILVFTVASCVSVYHRGINIFSWDNPCTCLLVSNVFVLQDVI